jgi:hypothetical protein
MVSVSLTHNEINLLLDAIDDFVADEMRSAKKGFGNRPMVLAPRYQRRVDAIKMVEKKLLKAKAKKKK